MTTVDFEARYRDEPDPWGYETSTYERHKYEATLRACGPGPFRSALELGGSIGVFSALLAPRCRHLCTIDGASTAVRAARRRLVDDPSVDVIEGRIPDDLPDRSFDLVVASETLYYLTAHELRQTLDVLESRMVRGARIVSVHWRPRGPERPLSADYVHWALFAQPRLTFRAGHHTTNYLLDVLERT
jgi:Nodulation protein S (NodS)